MNDVEIEIYDEEINALDWTITALKSRLWLFSRTNSEGVRCLEKLLEKLKKLQKDEYTRI